MDELEVKKEKFSDYFNRAEKHRNELFKYSEDELEEIYSLFNAIDTSYEGIRSKDKELVLRAEIDKYNYIVILKPLLDIQFSKLCASYEDQELETLLMWKLVHNLQYRGEVMDELSKVSSSFELAEEHF